MTAGSSLQANVSAARSVFAFAKHYIARSKEEKALQLLVAQAWISLNSMDLRSNEVRTRDIYHATGEW